MRYNKRLVEIQYADRVLGALNRVEMLRDSACSGIDFSTQSEEAARLWHTAQAMEKAIIRENSLPDIDAILYTIMAKADTCSGMVGGDHPIHSYVVSAKALYWIMLYIDEAIRPPMKKLLELIWADGYTVEYGIDRYPSEKMFKWQPPAPAEEGGAE